MPEPEKLWPATAFSSNSKTTDTPWLHPATANELSPKSCSIGAQKESGRKQSPIRQQQPTALPPATPPRKRRSQRMPPLPEAPAQPQAQESAPVEELAAKQIHQEEPAVLPMVLVDQDSADVEQPDHVEPDEEDELDEGLPLLAEPPAVRPVWKPEDGLSLDAAARLRRHEHGWLRGFLMGLLAALTVGAALYFLGAFEEGAALQKLF